MLPFQGTIFGLIKSNLSICTSLGLLIGVAQVFGQPDVDDRDVFDLSPFVVDASGDVGYTATSSLAGGRLATQLRDTAAAVSVMTEEFIRDIAATSFLEAARWAPNAIPQEEVRGQDLYNDYGVNFRSLGALYQARNYFRWYINSDSFSTDRIDFARGPNSIVFGDSGVGGVANVNSKRAHRRNFGEILGQWNSFGGYRLTADYNVEISEKIQLRAAGLLQRFEDWRDVGKNDREGLFLTTTIRPTSKTTVRLEGEWGDMHRLITFGMLDGYSQWDGVTTNPGFILPGEVPASLTRRGPDLLIFNAARPELGIVNWAGFAQTNGTFRQLLKEPQEGLPNHIVVPDYKRSLQANNAGVYNDYWTASAFVEHRFNDRLFFELAANYQEQTRDIRRWFFDAWTIDVNETQPDGSPNPYLGEAYGQARYWTDQQTNKISDIRASLAYLLDTSFTDQRFLISAGQRDDRFEVDHYEWVRTNGNNPNVRLAANRILARRYFSETSIDVGTVPNFDSVSGIEAKEAHTRALRSDKPITYYQVAAVGNWLPKRNLHTMFGLRQDRYREKANSDNPLRDPVTNEVTSAGQKQVIDRKNVTSPSVSAVYHFSEVFSVFAGYSQSFDPGGTALGIDGNGLPPLESVGKEGGFKLHLLNGKLAGSVTYYQNEQENNRIAGEDGSINRIWAAFSMEDRQVTAYRDRVSFKGSGWELDLTANPKPNWRLMFNIAFPDTEQTNGFSDTRAYVTENIDFWQAEIFRLESTGDLSDSLNADLASNNLQTIQGRIGGFAEGRRINDTLRYTANLFSRYYFNDGKLDGFSIGGGANLRGRRVVGNRPGDAFDYVYADSYILITAVLGYERQLKDGTLSFQLNISNLFDKEIVRPYRYNSYVSNGQAFFVPDQFNVQDPRRVMLTASYRF